jgi:hypothetical protein
VHQHRFKRNLALETCVEAINRPDLIVRQLN